MTNAHVYTERNAWLQRCRPVTEPTRGGINPGRNARFDKRHPLRGNTDSSWQPLVHDLTNEGLAFGHELAQALRSMHSATSDSLEDDGFLFQLYMPEGDNVSVFDRADALAGWVNHFLLGLGVTQPKLDKVKDETGEAIDDLRNIAQLGYDEDEDQEELEMSLEEIIEYVRVAALLCHDTFARQQPTAPEVRKPTLH
ncbi:exported protein [Klebsiella pneumoniae subsp. ozaenae]|uniref:UPF0149 protein NCTC10313_05975 n=3 Tax=Enterobacteriaceae TaxID=543 RepID=A0A378AMS8_KLEPO|nr:exported protein [Klebsiella pneumoniae subsp. ozaenae]